MGREERSRRLQNQALKDVAVRQAKDLLHAAEMLWVVLANVSGSDWTQQSEEWQEAAKRARDQYFEAVKHIQEGT